MLMIHEIYGQKNSLNNFPNWVISPSKICLCFVHFNQQTACRSGRLWHRRGGSFMEAWHHRDTPIMPLILLRTIIRWHKWVHLLISPYSPGDSILLSWLHIKLMRISSKCVWCCWYFFNTNPFPNPLLFLRRCSGWCVLFIHVGLNLVETGLSLNYDCILYSSFALLYYRGLCEKSLKRAEANPQHPRQHHFDNEIRRWTHWTPNVANSGICCFMQRRTPRCFWVSSARESSSAQLSSFGTNN